MVLFAELRPASIVQSKLAKGIKTMNVKYLFCSAIVAASFLSASADTRVNLLDFKSLVKCPGSEQEDWQPAFQAAIAKAFETTRIVYVPAGRYKIRKTIEIWRDKDSRVFDVTSFTLVGDGRFVTIIQQMDPTQNCVDWTGKTYKKSMSAGTMEKICLTGGKVTLNMKWHNQFTMRSCYISGGREAGIYAEGWSNRFLDILVRYCPRVGLRGSTHFNDITIRDGYFSRCGIGIDLPGGVHGVRISGLGFEHCTITAIYLRSTLCVSIDNCYFEGDGMSEDQSVLGSSVKIADGNTGFRVTGCLFRGTDPRSGQIMVATDNRSGLISYNTFQIHSETAGGEAMMYFMKPEPERNDSAYTGKLTIRDNVAVWTTKVRSRLAKQKVTMQPIAYRQAQAGMVEKLRKTGSQIPAGYTVVGSDGKLGKHDVEKFD